MPYGAVRYHNYLRKFGILKKSTGKKTLSPFHISTFRPKYISNISEEENVQLMLELVAK
jgi:hypothetical protein